MNIFEASVQYNDFKGSTASDRSDNESLVQYLISQGFADDDELVIGCRFGFSGNHGQEVYVNSVVIYLKKNVGEFEKAPEIVRAIDIPMTLPKLFSFFKRFDLVMNVDGLDLDATKVDGPHYD